MSVQNKADVSYRRSRFFTRLPKGHYYTNSHFWIGEVETDLWQIGLTKFAARMLGDIVEINFDVKSEVTVTVGDVIGSMEGFKAVTDIYCVVSGKFAGENMALHEDITLADTDPYRKGWLYQVQGKPDPEKLDVEGYVALLDTTIDKMEDHNHEA